jgi:hypothetical protein
VTLFKVACWAYGIFIAVNIIVGLVFAYISVFSGNVNYGNAAGVSLISAVIGGLAGGFGLAFWKDHIDYNRRYRHS